MIRLVVGLFLIAVPVLELAVLIKIGQWIGVWATVALVVTMAFTGILIISQQSFTRHAPDAGGRERRPAARRSGARRAVPDGGGRPAADARADHRRAGAPPPGAADPARGGALEHRTAASACTGRRATPTTRRPALVPEQQHRPETAREGPVIEGEFERLGETSTGSRRGNGASHRLARGQPDTAARLAGVAGDAAAVLASAQGYDTPTGNDDGRTGKGRQRRRQRRRARRSRRRCG